MEFRTQPMIEAALREARQEAAQEAPQPERTEQQDAACGMLPACAPLANPFVPFQRDDPPVYAAAVGAVRGTLFPGLDLPLRGQENSGELSGTLQRDLQALGFAVGELGEYLDTHPGDAHVVNLTVALPIKEDDLTCRRLKVVVLPLPTVFEPLHPVDAACEFWYHATVDIAALIRTPTYKAGAPFHTPVKAVPRPIGLTAHIADLR